jgi:hypothetical protein
MLEFKKPCHSLQDNLFYIIKVLPCASVELMLERCVIGLLQNKVKWVVGYSA